MSINIFIVLLFSVGLSGFAVNLNRVLLDASDVDFDARGIIRSIAWLFISCLFLALAFFIWRSK